MAGNDMLRNPLAKAKPLAKAPRTEHPEEPVVASTPEPTGPGDSQPAITSSNRLGPNRIRKSFYLPTDTAEALATSAARIHHQSAGRVSKAEAAGAIIRFGLNNMRDVHNYLQVGVDQQV